MAATTVAQDPPTSREDLTIKAYGAPILIPSPQYPAGVRGVPDLIGYVFTAGETPVFGLQEATDFLGSNFPTFGPLTITRPCDFHSVLWLVDLRELRRLGVASTSMHVLGRKCPHCAKEGQQLTLLSQGVCRG